MSSDPWSSEQYDSAAQRLLETGDYDGALALLREGAGLFPGSAELRVSIGYAELGREEYLWARRAFEEALVLEADHEDALVGLGECLLKFGERSRAYHAFERVLELGFGDDLDLMLAIGRALYREGLVQVAERFQRMAVEADASSSEAAAELGYTLARRGEREEAARWLRRALEIEPANHEARAFHGNLLYENRDFTGALDELEVIPPTQMWDPLAVWRRIELLRGFRGLDARAPQLEPLLKRLQELYAEPSPEEQLLAQLEAAGAEAEPFLDLDQLDLFTLSPRGAEAPLVHAVRLQGGRLVTGDWTAIVCALRDSSPDPSVSLREFMKDEARRVRNLTGVVVPADDPEAFLRGSARAGVLRIER